MAWKHYTTMKSYTNYVHWMVIVFLNWYDDDPKDVSRKNAHEKLNWPLRKIN